MARRSRGGSNRRAASSRTGSASAARWSGRSWVPAARTWAWAGEMVPSARAWAVPVRGPRCSARAVRTKPAAVPAPMRRRCAARRRWSRPGRPARRRRRRGRPRRPGRQPVAFQAVHQPPQGHDPFGQGAIGQPVDPLVDQPVELGRQRRQPRWPATRSNGCSSPWRQPIRPTSEHKHQPENVENPPVTDPTRPSIRGTPLARAGEPRGSSATLRSRATRHAWRVHGARTTYLWPGEPMGPPGREPASATVRVGVIRRPRSPPRRGWRGWWRG